MITNADITIYNHCIDPATRQTVYVRHVIQDVSWYASVNVSAASGGLAGGNVYKIRIPPEALADGQPALDTYCPAKEYASLKDAEGVWTAQTVIIFARAKGRRSRNRLIWKRRMCSTDRSKAGETIAAAACHISVWKDGDVYGYKDYLADGPDGSDFVKARIE